MTLVLRYFTRSDRGLVRSNNEDSAFAGHRLLALADGMGGHAAGEVASRLVIEALSVLDADEPGNDLLGALEEATRIGNEAIAAEVEAAPELDGMGTTLTAILFSGSRIGLCHVGDSRGYMFRDGQISQITRDDTFVQTLVDEGRITPEQAHTHPQRSLIMRALTGTEVEPTLTMREARAGDRYLLCSDGLSDVVTEDTLAETLGSYPNPQECADRLIELALRGGGPDNVTVVIGDVVENEVGQSRPIMGGAADGNEDTYTPDPKTAAGRAAALRPPPPEPVRSAILDAEPAPPKSTKVRNWVIVGIIVAIIIALAAAFLVFRAVVKNNYYVSESNGEVVVFQGSPESFGFFSISTPVQRVCVEDVTTAPTPRYTFIDYDSRCARALQVADLTPEGKEHVSMVSIRNVKQPTAEDRARTELPFQCDPAPTVSPTPTPSTQGREQTATPAPRPGTSGNSSETSQPPSEGNPTHPGNGSSPTVASCRQV
ncbi:protein phosphatase 2C domain-containing protein [Gordonia sp. ABSL1-1]|uniref:PP2C family protein-serine/threonine phosphatase n=1 Tax=Gordonia sp. ABSL1-1 TaxID=3053923 RepID=UPI002572C43B|nr:protein phosphatase 2C domain-containing protein [Gordonia sp. ABSL1-1]MDL9936647.1 protein phosphatase 2C domain-containing protein [Gordonia sp. ABSL1-1]